MRKRGLSRTPTYAKEVVVIDVSVENKRAVIVDCAGNIDICLLEQLSNAGSVWNQTRKERMAE